MWCNHPGRSLMTSHSFLVEYCGAPFWLRSPTLPSQIANPHSTKNETDRRTGLGEPKSQFEIRNHGRRLEARSTMARFFTIARMQARCLRYKDARRLEGKLMPGFRRRYPSPCQVAVGDAVAFLYLAGGQIQKW
jgi:hypothetical protein